MKIQKVPLLPNFEIPVRGSHYSYSLRRAVHGPEDMMAQLKFHGQVCGDVLEHLRYLLCKSRVVDAFV